MGIIEVIFAMIFMVIFFILLPVVLLVVYVTQYILRSIALYRYAKQTGACKPGLAWIPVYQYWVLGKCAETCSEQRGENDGWPLAKIALIASIVQVCTYFIALPQSLLFLINLAFTLVFLLCTYKIYRNYLSSPADVLLTLLHATMGLGNLGLFVVSFFKPLVGSAQDTEPHESTADGVVIDAE